MFAMRVSVFLIMRDITSKLRGKEKMGEQNYYKEGRSLQERQAHSEAFLMYQLGADKDDEDCWCALGDCYLNGIGVETDIEKALEAYQMASELGSAEAEYSLGILYEEGYYIEENFEHAISWLKKAAERGHIEAQYRLGDLYATWGTEPNSREKARYWWNKAMEQGHLYSKMALGQMYLSRDNQFFNYEKGTQYLTEVADDLEPYIQYCIGNGYYFDEIQPNYKEARLWYEKASVKGVNDANFMLGCIYYEGNGVDIDYAKARGYLEAYVTCIQPSNAPFLNNDKELGRVYFYLANICETSDGKNEADLFLAIQYYHKAIDKGYDCAASLSALETRINVGAARNNRMGKFSQEIIRKKLSIDQLYPAIEAKLKEEFGTIWDLLQNSSRECLVTGFLAYIALFSMGEKYFESMDFSAAILPVVKACEIELERLFFKKYLAYLKENKIQASEFTHKLPPFVEEKVSKEDGEVSIVYVDENKSGVYTLGKLAYYADIRLIKKGKNSFRHFGNNTSVDDIHVNEHFLAFANKVFKEEAFSKGNRQTELKQYLYDFSGKLSDIAKKLRNPAAHTEKMCYWAAVYCGNVIVMVEQVLRNFIKKIKPEYLQ